MTIHNYTVSVDYTLSADYMLSTEFIRTENQNIIWNVLTQMNVFSVLASEKECIAFFRNSIGQMYDELNNQRIPYTMQNLQEANRHVLRKMVTELKAMRNPPVHLPPINNALPAPPNAHAPHNTHAPAPQKTTMTDMFEMRKQEYVAANTKPVLPDNPFEMPKDEPITNMEELIERHKQGQPTVSTFSAFDAARMTMNPLLVSKTPQEEAQVLSDLQRQIGELRDEIGQIRKLIEKS